MDENPAKSNTAEYDLSRHIGPSLPRALESLGDASKDAQARADNKLQLRKIDDEPLWP
jgi:hypothetical protein